MKAPTPIPVTVITGFLGAGKSTLVERWLRELPKDETAVIINEAGEVGIDGALLSSHASRLREITGGCVCCVTQQQLAACLLELVETDPTPTRILVETSGAASPAGVIRALCHGPARDRLRLDGVITVVDATRARRALQYDLGVEQLGFADIVVLSHLDRASQNEVDSLTPLLESHAPTAVLAHSRSGAVEMSGEGEATLVGLLTRRSQVLRVRRPQQTAHHPIQTVALTHDGELDEGRFGDWVERALGALEARILRIKGILAIEGTQERVILQGVGEAIEITLGAPWASDRRTSRLVVLGLGLPAAELEEGFAACSADPGRS